MFNLDFLLCSLAALTEPASINNTALNTVRIYDTSSDWEVSLVMEVTVPPLAVQGIGGAYAGSSAYFLVVLSEYAAQFRHALTSCAQRGRRHAESDPVATLQIGQGPNGAACCQRRPTWCAI